MAFQLKNFTSIVASMVNHVRAVSAGRLTDFNVGSVLRTMLEAPAIEIDEAYQQAFNGLKEAIPVATYTSFNFERQPAIAASGVVRLSWGAVQPDVSLVIPAGTILRTDVSVFSYALSDDVVWAMFTFAGGVWYADVLAACTTAGSAGNIAINSAFTVSGAPVGLQSVIATTAFGSGRDLESDDARKRRFVEYINSLARSTTDAMTFGAKSTVLRNALGVTIERVAFAVTIEPYLSNQAYAIGDVEVYVHNGVGATSANLVAEVDKVLRGYTGADGVKVAGWKAAGTRLLVYAATEVAKGVTGTIKVAYGYLATDVLTRAQDAVREYILGLDIGASYQASEVIYRIKNMPGVLNVSMTTGGADVACAVTEKFAPGVITFTAV
jgi:uncharacterized phage protein gp47/JayE